MKGNALPNNTQYDTYLSQNNKLLLTFVFGGFIMQKKRKGNFL